MERSDWRNPIENAGRIVEASIDLVGNILDNVERLVSGVVRDSVDVARESEALYDAAGDSLEAVRDAVRATPRFARIVGEGLRLVASYRVHEAKAGILSPEGAAAELEALHRANAKRLYELCVELRGGVLKLGQFISCRMDLLPRAYVEELSALQDRVPPVGFDAIRQRIESELGAPLEELFLELDPEPIAAASLAQVHAAVLADGTPVAVKVQVPGIEEIIEIDMAALRIVAGALGDTLPKMDMGTISKELTRSVRRELDFQSEAENAAEFARCFAGDENVVAPRVRDDLSSGRVLVMDRIDGERLLSYLDGCAERGEEGVKDLKRIFEILVGSYCAQVLRHGLLHADPHPGNFLVCTGPRVAFVDFGSVQRYTSETRRAYAELAGAILVQDQKKVADLLEVMGFRTRNGDSDSLLEFAEMMLELFRDNATVDLASIDPEEQLRRALEIGKRNPVVRIPQEFVMLGRVFAALAGLLLHYKPDINLFALIAPHLSSALAPDPG